MIEEIRKSIIALKTLEGYIESSIYQTNMKKQELATREQELITREQECTKVIEENKILKEELNKLKETNNSDAT